MPHRHDIHVLNDLIAATLDSAERLDRVSADSETTGHANLFLALANERRDIARDLQQTVILLGGVADQNGSILAKAQRAVMDMSHALLNDEANLVGAADRGEAQLDKRFEVALADERLTAPTLETLRRAHAAIHRETMEVHDLSHSLQGQRDAGSGLFPH